jgi:hypothetical protein
MIPKFTGKFSEGSQRDYCPPPDANGLEAPVLLIEENHAVRFC